MEALELENPLWAFALDFYARPGVADACLTLQDALDADVVALIVVLYAWLHLDRSLSEAEVADIQAGMQPWRNTSVLPLRHVRRALKPRRRDIPDEAKELLRDQIKRTELLAEQIQLAWAHDWLAKLPRTEASAGPAPLPPWFLTAPKDPMSDSCARAFSTVSETLLTMRR